MPAALFEAHFCDLVAGFKREVSQGVLAPQGSAFEPRGGLAVEMFGKCYGRALLNTSAARPFIGASLSGESAPMAER